MVQCQLPSGYNWDSVLSWVPRNLLPGTALGILGVLDEDGGKNLVSESIWLAGQEFHVISNLYGWLMVNHHIIQELTNVSKVHAIDCFCQMG